MPFNMNNRKAEEISDGIVDRISSQMENICRPFGIAGMTTPRPSRQKTLPPTDWSGESKLQIRKPKTGDFCPPK